MPISRFLSVSVRRPYALAKAQSLLTWLYANYERPEQCRLGFWVWYTGSHSLQGVRGDLLLKPSSRPPAREVAWAEGRKYTSTIDDRLASTASWDWLVLQKWLREVMEGQFSQLEMGRGVGWPVTPRALTVERDKKGRSQLRWCPVEGRHELADEFLLSCLDSVLTDLHGMSADVLGRCRLCQRYFIRRRAGRGEFCSPACRYKAKNQRWRVHRTAKRGRRRSKKGGNHEPTQRA